MRYVGVSREVDWSGLLNRRQQSIAGSNPVAYTMFHTDIQHNRLYLHIGKIVGGWIPYISIIVAIIVYPAFLKHVELFAIISFLPAMVQRVIIDSMEYLWERRIQEE